jgi:hypothetical protein
MRRTPLLVLAALAALVLGVLTAAPATAQGKPNHATVKDRSGDAPAGIDLLSGKYALVKSPKKAATFEVKVKDLTETTFLAFEIWPLNSGWDRLAVFRENGKTQAKLYAVYNDEDGVEPQLRKCKALKVSWNTTTNTVSARLPWACLVLSQSGSPGAYEFHTFSKVGGASSSSGDFLKARTLDF